jgi:hypothetical protein
MRPSDQRQRASFGHKILLPEECPKCPYVPVEEPSNSIINGHPWPKMASLGRRRGRDFRCLVRGFLLALGRRSWFELRIDRIRLELNLAAAFTRVPGGTRCNRDGSR